ncbi:DUF5615 family PIN-like protein [Halosimplex halophilum]|uniref:DUF5615 family PIN-like protein n=1 Tax=Halosimplex halophilum TaxID=2559572 RepID=UPI00107F7EBB|nr:DUF5615 family PIN-like protein [Halosimplex halophilum]
MAVSVLLDENVEHEVCHRLRSDGYDADHVDFHDRLGKGDSDRALAQYSLENDALIVTYDDDFETHYGESEYWGYSFSRTTTGTRPTSPIRSSGSSKSTHRRSCAG